MKIELHPDASMNFNEKVEGLLFRLAPMRPERSSEPKSSFSPDTFVSGHVTQEDIIGEIRFATINGAGAEVAKSFWYDNKEIGLEGEAHKELIHISQEMQRTKILRDIVSINFLTEHIFEWIKEKYRGATDLPMVEYVLTKCEQAIEEYEIWIPVAMLYVQSEIQIGKITFKTITKEMLDRLSERTLKQNPKDKDGDEQYLRKKRKELQGLAASTIKVYGEYTRAYEIALEETEKSVAALRVFSPANLIPEVNSYCAPLGTENIPKEKYLLIEDGEIVGNSRSMDLKPIERWIIDDRLLEVYRQDGLQALSDILAQDKRSEFEEKVIDSLIWYSKSCLESNLSDKLIYILVGLESILLRNTNEPIGKNIRERMALLIRDSVDERKSVIKNVQKTYRLRSSFLHHGNAVKIENAECLKEFMLNSFLFFITLIKNAARFSTQEEFVHAIEKRKLTN